MKQQMSDLLPKTKRQRTQRKQFTPQADEAMLAETEQEQNLSEWRTYREIDPRQDGNS